jgi:hypothetical protein
MDVPLLTRVPTARSGSPRAYRDSGRVAPIRARQWRWWRVGQAAACRASLRRRTGPRNVRTPPGRVLGNTQSGRPAGKCHREQTADGGIDLRSGPAQVRVKRCGKSAPAPGVTRAARQTPPGARPDRGRTARPQTPPGRPLEPAGNRRPRGMAAGERRGSSESGARHRIRRTGRLATTNAADQGFRSLKGCRKPPQSSASPQ